MKKQLWMVRDAKAEPWDGRTEPDWRYSVLVFARSPQGALWLAARYDAGELRLEEVVHGGTLVFAVADNLRDDWDKL